MLAITLLCMLAAAVMVLHACAAHVRDGEDLHNLTVRVHTLRNEYLANLRGEDTVEIIEVDETGPVAGQIGPDAPVEVPQAA